MALSHDGFNFYLHNHTPVVRLNAPALQVSRREVFGVEGEFHIIGERTGSDLSCVMTMDGFATRTLLQDQLDVIQAQAGELRGTLQELLPKKGDKHPMLPSSLRNSDFLAF